jgi:hypothetical protein
MGLIYGSHVAGKSAGDIITSSDFFNTDTNTIAKGGELIKASHYPRKLYRAYDDFETRYGTVSRYGDYGINFGSSGLDRVYREGVYYPETYGVDITYFAMNCRVKVNSSSTYFGVGYFDTSVYSYLNRNIMGVVFNASYDDIYIYEGSYVRNKVIKYNYSVGTYYNISIRIRVSGRYGYYVYAQVDNESVYSYVSTQPLYGSYTSYKLGMYAAGGTATVSHCYVYHN